MSSVSMNTLSNSYLQSILSRLQNAGLTANETSNSTGSVVASTSTQQSDSTQLSPLAQILTTLQQLQQSNPTEYKQVTAQIATNLTSAAATAQAEGNTTAATQLNQLATDFTNASQSGQLPNIQDLAQAVGGHHHHHHHAQAAASDSDTSSSSSSDATSSSASSTTASQLTSELLAAMQASGAQSGSLNPLNIILNTLSQAGLGSQSQTGGTSSNG
jgi:hypothetical protein